MFHKVEFGSKGRRFPRPPSDLYEVVPEQSQDSTYSTEKTWADVPIQDRIKQNVPITKLVDVVAAARCNVLQTEASEVLSIVKLHGQGYAKSSGRYDIANAVAIARNNTEPSYSCGVDGSVLAGGLAWDSPLKSQKINRVRCSLQIAVAAVTALTYNKSFHTLSFDGCCTTFNADQLEILRAMVGVCQYNTHLCSISFPFCSNTTPAQPGLAGQLASVWRNVGQALCANSRPLFTSLDFSGACMGDAGVEGVMPGLVKLFSSKPTGLGLRPVSLKFGQNALTPAGVTQICSFLSSVAELDSLSTLSFEGNPWCSSSSVDAVVAVVRKASALKVLNVEVEGANADAVGVLLQALVKTACPLEEVNLAGGAVLSAKVNCVLLVLLRFQYFVFS